MAYKAHDGKAFNSPSMGMAYDKRKKAAPKEHAAHADMETGSATSNIHEVVQQHGKAHKTETHHDHEAGKHHMVSHHEDGHVHHGEVHDNAEDAHEDAKMATQEPEMEQEQEPEMAAQAPAPSDEMTSSMGV